MRLQQKEAGATEQRYDAHTLKQVTALALELQNRDEQTLTAQQMEEIGAEVGVKRDFVRRAIAQITRPRGTVSGMQQRAVTPTQTERTHKGIIAAWWGAAWVMLPIAATLTEAVERMGTHLGPTLMLLAIAIYVGAGSYLSAVFGSDDEQTPKPDEPVSRDALIETLFTLRRELEGQKEHRAFLSVDVAGSSEMKRQGSELEVEYSFGQFRRWVEGLVREAGGELHSAAGDGLMAAFPTDEAALRVARHLQAELPAFNAGRNQLGQPFRVRCGLSAGEVPVAAVPLGELQSAVVDRAALLQKRGEPGAIAVAAELFGAAQRELGDLTLLPEPLNDQPAFLWRPGGAS